jgi:hypothetical protein
VNFEDAVELVRSFWPGRALPFGPGDPRQVDRLERELGRTLPGQLRDYVVAQAPSRDLDFETVGNPITLYSAGRLAARVDGYNWNPVKNRAIEDWSKGWFLIGEEGADPIVVDLDQTGNDEPCVVLTAPHGQGEWDFDECASSLPLFLVLAAAQHHALTGIVKQVDAIVDDEHGFNLCAPAARWYFPFVRRIAPEHYDRWTMTFENASSDEFDPGPE